ncbi:hypothetical protein [Geobacter sp. FeAm09]|uniref:hypothetical protein n=1 Tax=Geobacter sp. FeAm09 TaxID=2597769 RepID=UPI00197AE8EF|nr:hypothetical protein [Geobacter sp. FeAm09]
MLISIDDTDDIESPGTGEVADILAAGIEARGWGRCGPVTRHQLLLAPEIPYTSHNSSMCFTADVCEDMLSEIAGFCGSELEAQSVPGSDPGLCIVLPERLPYPDRLIEFGRKAKESVISKNEAYELSAFLGVHLSEHGGTGQGVIGALAGAGLRLSGNDGRFKGKFRIPSRQGVASVKDIRTSGIDLVQALDGEQLHDDETVLVGDWVKPVLMAGKTVLLAVPQIHGGNVCWKACERKVFKDY